MRGRGNPYLKILHPAVERRSEDVDCLICVRPSHGVLHAILLAEFEDSIDSENTRILKNMAFGIEKHVLRQQ